MNEFLFSAHVTLFLVFAPATNGTMMTLNGYEIRIQNFNGILKKGREKKKKETKIKNGFQKCVQSLGTIVG